MTFESTKDVEAGLQSHTEADATFKYQRPRQPTINLLNCKFRNQSMGVLYGLIILEVAIIRYLKSAAKMP